MFLDQFTRNVKILITEKLKLRSIGNVCTMPKAISKAEHVLIFCFKESLIFSER